MERKKAKAPSIAGLASYNQQGGRACGVCSSVNRKFIEKAVVEGHSRRAIREYFLKEFGEKLPNLSHHMTYHVTKKAS